MSVVRFSYETCKAIDKFHISVDGAQVVGIILLLCRACGMYRSIRIAVNVVTFNYTFAANNIYVLAILYNLAGPDLIDSED